MSNHSFPELTVKACSPKRNGRVLVIARLPLSLV